MSWGEKRLDRRKEGMFFRPDVSPFISCSMETVLYRSFCRIRLSISSTFIVHCGAAPQWGSRWKINNGSSRMVRMEINGER